MQIKVVCVRVICNLTLHNIKIIMESSEIMNRLLKWHLGVYFFALEIEFCLVDKYRNGGGYGTSTVTVFYGGSTV